MHLETNIIVPQTPKQIWDLFNDPYFLVKWDRSVEQVIPTSENPTSAVGFTFDTIAPLKKGQKKPLRMSYRITEFIPDYQAKVSLEKSNMFKEAIWTMRVEPATNGTLITCLVDLKVSPKYFFMVPLLYLNKKAIYTDLEYLKKAIDAHYTN
ncbi:MAG TPA: SRPBCC family protein [Mucilaginibacter sp.]|jgi:hypothetical protein